MMSGDIRQGGISTMEKGNGRQAQFAADPILAEDEIDPAVLNSILYAEEGDSGTVESYNPQGLPSDDGDVDPGLLAAILHDGDPSSATRDNVLMPSISSDLPGDDGDDDSGSSLFGSPRNAGVVDDEFIQNQLQMLQSRATPRAAPAKQPLLSQVVKERMPDAPELFRGDTALHGTQLSRAESTASGMSGLSNAKGVLTHAEIVWLSETSGAKLKRTCITASASWVAIGSTCGTVLVFNRMTMVLKHQLKLPPIITANGSAGATCLCVCSNEEFLLSGHESGLVVVWDLKQGVLVRDVSDAHVRPIIEVASVGPRRFVVACCGGIVSLISLSKVLLMHVVNKHVLIDGPATVGAILSLASMPPSFPHQHQHQQHDPCSADEEKRAADAEVRWGQLVAFCSTDTAFVVSVHPETRVLFKLRRPKAAAAGGALPLLAWSAHQANLTPGHGLWNAGEDAWGEGGSVLGSSRLGGSRMGDTASERDGSVVGSSRRGSGEGLGVEERQRGGRTLALGWGEDLRLVQVMWGQKGGGGKGERPAFADGGQRKMSGEIMAVQWLGADCVLVLCKPGTVTAVDVRSGLVMETAPWPGELAKHSLLCTAITDGVQRDRSLRNAVCAVGGKCWMLTEEGPIHTTTLLTWTERMEALVVAGEWEGALMLGAALLKGRALGSERLQEDEEARREVESKLEGVLGGLLGDMMGKVRVGTEQAEAMETVSRVCEVAGRACVEMGRPEWLFGEVHAACQGCGQEGAYLGCLERWILAGRVRLLPPDVMQRLLEWLRAQRERGRMEDCMLHIDLSSLDFHRAVKLCRDERLSRALVYLYNTGLNDFSTPAAWLLSCLDEGSGGEGEHECATALRRYLAEHCTVQAGESHGSGVCHALVSMVFYGGEEVAKQRGDATDPHDAVCATCRQGLRNVLVLLSAGGLEGCRLLGAIMAGHAAGEGGDAPKQGGGRRCVAVHDMVQRLVLLVQTTTVTAERGHGETEESLVLGRRGGGGLGLLGGSSRRCRMQERVRLQVMEVVLEQAAAKRASLRPELLLEWASALLQGWELEEGAGEGPGRREALLVALVNGGLLPLEEATSGGGGGLAELAERAGMYKLCYALNRTGGDYQGVLRACVAERGGSAGAGEGPFVLLHSLLSDPSLPASHRTSLLNAILDNLPSLTALHARATASLLLASMPSQVLTACSRLDAHPPLQFRYLRALLRLHGWGRGGGDGPSNEEGGGGGLRMGAELQERFIGLACTFCPEDVLPFLASHDGYRLEHALAACRASGVVSAAAFVLERMGATEQGVGLMLKDVGEKLRALEAAMAHSEAGPPAPLTPQSAAETHVPGGPKRASEGGVGAEGYLEDGQRRARVLAAIREVEAASRLAMELCRRSAERSDDKEAMDIWFSLLDTFVSAQIRSREPGREDAPSERVGGLPSLSQVLDDVIREVLGGMLGRVSVDVLLALLVKAHPQERLASLRGIIQGSLEALRFQRTLLDITHRMMLKDSAGLQHDFVNQSYKSCAARRSFDTVSAPPAAWSLSLDGPLAGKEGAVLYWNGQLCAVDTAEQVAALEAVHDSHNPAAAAKERDAPAGGKERDAQESETPST